MQTRVNFSLYSDHMPFSLRGIHTARLMGDAGFKASSGSRGWGHTKADTNDKVDIRNLRESAAILAIILLRMANSKELPFKRKTNGEIKEMLEHYNYDEARVQVATLHG
jgi:Zn-dependent M28 family amino/carboxypeptidase